MESNVRMRILNQIRDVAGRAVICDRRFLDDEQLIRSEQLELLDTVFNANVRDAEIQELSSHFVGLFRGGHPAHLAIWGKTGTGKTLTIHYFLNLLFEMCREQGITFRHEHLDLSTPQPCFRAFNDLACLLGASRRYRQGISLEELMLRIESALAAYEGYFVLIVDECDHVRRDAETFFAFLIRRLPQSVRAKLILVLVSNKLDWPDHLDPRVKSFLKMNELLFTPYNALDLQHILQIRVNRALEPGVMDEGVVEKISALASREHGDARKAVNLLAKSAYLAEKGAGRITLAVVDQAKEELDRDRFLLMIRTAPAQLQAVMAAAIDAVHKAQHGPVGSAEAYSEYKLVCERASLRPLSPRAFADLLAELDLYSLLRTRVMSRGRYGRTREIFVDLPDELVARIRDTVAANLGISKPTGTTTQ